MVTKVRGDKIKEGSIPLSALSNDVKYVTGSYNVEAVFNAAGTYPFNFADYYFCKVGNKFVSLSGIGDGRSIQIFDGPPIYIKYEYNGRSTCVITDVSGYISKERPVEIVTINKSNSLFLPDGIGGANWNAQQGEAGYIDNKPLGIIKSNNGQKTNINSLFVITENAFYPTNDLFIKYNNKIV